MKCVHCGTQNTDDAKHCRRCGAVLPLSAEANRTGPSAINTPIEIGPVRVKVLDGRLVENAPGIPVGGAFYLVDFTVENIGEDALNVSDFVFELLDYARQKYKLSETASKLGLTTSPNGQLLPRLSGTFMTGFEVPSNITGPILTWIFKPGATFKGQAAVAVPLPDVVDVNRTHPLSEEQDRIGTKPLHDTGPKSGPLYARQAPASDTRPLQRVRNFFEPLPERALVNEGRCLIRSLQEESPLLNVYSAVSRRALAECRQCGFARNNFGDQYCLQCGASLGGIEPNYPNYVVKETLAPDAIAIERQLAEMELHHGGALIPIETFTEIILGTRRVYVVLPEPSPFTGETLPSSPELNDVINWGVQLADALAFLHKNNVSFGAAHLNHMSISGKAARWFNFTSARIQSPGTRTRKAYIDDLQSLTASLFVLLTGKVYSPDIQLEPPGLDAAVRETFTGQIASASQLAERLRDVIAEIRRPNSYDLRVGRLTDVGHVRQLNEDSLLTLELGRVHRSVGSPIGLYVVADGMGGHSAGDIASGLAINALAQHAVATLLPLEIDDGTPMPEIEAWLREAINVANTMVHEQRKLAGTNMGTTLVMAYIAGGQAYLANVGDSRGYVVNDSGIQQLTVDHSLVQRLVDTKQLTPEEAHHYFQKNVIYKNLGDRATVIPDIRVVELQPGDRLLLCSDGLLGWGSPVKEAEAQRIIMAAASPQDACRQLIDAANAAGGPDNITAIIVQMEPLG
jgi:protein phosphatase